MNINWTEGGCVSWALLGAYHLRRKGVDVKILAGFTEVEDRSEFTHAILQIGNETYDANGPHAIERWNISDWRSAKSVSNGLLVGTELIKARHIPEAINVWTHLILNFNIITTA
jgi:hypothetical protein